MVQSNYSKDNCVVCLLSPILTFGSAIKCSPFEGLCSHKKSYSGQPFFKKTKQSNFICFIVTIMESLSIVMYAYLFTDAIVLLETIQLISELLFSTLALCESIFFFSISKKRMIDLNGNILLLQSCEKLGFVRLISKNGAKKLKILYISYCSMVFTLVFAIVSIILFNLNNLSLELPRIVLSFLNIYLQIGVMAQMSNQTAFLHGVIENFNEHVRYYLKQRLRNVEAINIQNILKVKTRQPNRNNNVDLTLTKNNIESSHNKNKMKLNWNMNKIERNRNEFEHKMDEFEHKMDEFEHKTDELQIKGAFGATRIQWTNLSEAVDLEERLSKLRLFWSTTVTGVNYLNKSLNAIIVVWFVHIILILVVNLFVIVKSVQLGAVTVFTIRAQLKTFGTIFWAMTLILFVDKVKHLVNIL